MTLNRWSPTLFGHGPEPAGFKTLKAALADLQIAGDELIVTPVPRAPWDTQAEDALLRWAPTAGYRRVWLPERVVTFDGPPPLGQARVDCPSCGARWEDGSANFSGSSAQRRPVSRPLPGVRRLAARVVGDHRCRRSAMPETYTDHPMLERALRPRAGCSPPITTAGSCARARRSRTSRTCSASPRSCSRWAAARPRRSARCCTTRSRTAAAGRCSSGSGPSSATDAARIVEANSDSDSEPKPPWEPAQARVPRRDRPQAARRAARLARRQAPQRPRDPARLPHATATPFWDRFKPRRRPGSIRWYYRALDEAFSARRDALGPMAEPALEEFGRTVAEIDRLS